MTRGRAAAPLAPLASRTSLRRLTAAAVVLAAVATGAVASPAGEAWRVVDGDTFDLAGERIRLFGKIISCIRGRGGIRAELRPGRLRRCRNRRPGRHPVGRAGPLRAVSTDRYGRTLARCRAGALDLNREMVRRGMAWAFVRYADDYAADEKAAKASGIGIWQHPSQSAWEYRAETWDRAAKEAPAGCAIKGNISTSGKIDHPPWSPWYEKTRISTERGEQWFCSEDEAVAAGWRAPRWR